MLHSFIGYHGFAITKRGNDIQISYGLLERHTNTFSYDRIKAVKITQGLVQRMLGFAAIRLEVIGYTNGTDDDSKNAGIGVLVPFCKYSEVGEILGKVLPDYVPDERQTKAVSYFPFVSWFALTLGIVAGVILLPMVVSMAVLGASPTVMLTVSLAVLGLGAILLAVKALNAAFSYRNNGLALNGSKITAYYGGFVKNITVFMAKNLIAAESITTPLRKKKGIASLVIHLKTNAASNEIKVHIQKEDLSENLESMLML
jgi:putative membrane protein